MLYREFLQYTPWRDSENPNCNAYRSETGHLFYVEPGFYEGLMGYAEKRADRYQELLNEIYRLIEKFPRLVFVGDFEHPFVEKEEYVYREVTDIADVLGIFVEDKSRGADYGD